MRKYLNAIRQYYYKACSMFYIFSMTFSNFRLFQPYANFLVLAVMLAIPYGLPEIVEGARDDFSELLGEIDSYIN